MDVEVPCNAHCHPIFIALNHFESSYHLSGCIGPDAHCSAISEFEFSVAAANAHCINTIMHFECTVWTSFLN